MCIKHLVFAGATLCLASPAFAAHELEGRDLMLGETLYAVHCAVCHGANLEGQLDWQTPDENGILPAPPHDETGHTWHHEIWSVLAYIRSTWPERIQQVQQMRNRAH